MSPSPAAPRPAHRIYCLCAEWCGACREWRTSFDAMADAHPQDQFVWVDIDAHEAVLDALDIETFPMLLIGVDEQVLFCGPVQPIVAVVQRLLERLEAPSAVCSGAQQVLDYLATVEPLPR